MDILRASEPVRQGAGNQDSDDGKQEGERPNAEQALTHHSPRAAEILGAAGVGHLHGEARYHGHREAVENPGARGHEAD